MATIDERIVSMVFENTVFEARIAKTMGSLSKLDGSLKKIGQTNSLGDIEKQANKVTLQGPMAALDRLKSRFSRSGADAAAGMSQIDKAGNRVTLQQPITALNKVQSAVGNVGARAPGAFNEIERSASRVSFSGLTSSLGNVTAKFSTLQAAASVALGNIAAKAVSVGTNVVKSLTLSPVMAGFHNYETQINAVQTIMANTGLTGKKGLGTVQKSLDELNTYANKTVYNFSEMAKNIGTFTAAGVKLKPAVASIKGIANLAALSGSNSQQASTAMYQLSQAIAAGRVGLQDWNSVVNAGMGGAVFQKALMRTAEAMGTVHKGAVKIDKATGKATINGEAFRQSIQAKPGQTSWLTADVLTKTLGQFTGDMTDAQLASEGFSKAQIKSIQTQAKAAEGAATNIKTISQLMDALKEEVATAWGSIFKTIFGNIFDATSLFSKIHTAVENFLTIPIYNFNKVLQGWAKLGGRTDLFKGIHKAVADLGAVIKPIKDAFREIFPPATAKSLFAVTEGFKHLMDRLTIGHATADNIKRTFAGLFAVLHIGMAIVKGVIGVIGQLLGVVGHGSGGILNFTGSIGDFLVALDNTLTKGGLLTRFFDGLASVLKVPLHLLGALTSLLSGLFGGVGKATSATDGLNAVKGAAGPLAGVLNTLKKAWDGLVQIFQQAKDLVSPWLDKIGQELSGLAGIVKHAFEGENFDKVMSTLQTAFLGGLFIVIKKAITGATTELSGALGGINKVMGQLTSNLKTMQEKVKAQIILEIATAIAVLAASAFVLSKIPPGALGKAMLAIAVGLGELMGAMKLITGGMGAAGFAKIPVLAAGMILLATSMVILGGAAKIFATMSWNEIAKGLVGIGGGLAAIGLGMKFLGPGTIVQGPAILILAVALNGLALAVKQFASLSWVELGRGLAGVMGVLVAMSVPLAAFGPEILLVGPGLIAVSFAMSMLAGVVQTFGSMDLKTMAAGMLGIALSLTAISGGIMLIPPTVGLQAVGLLILSSALIGIGEAVKVFGTIGIGPMIKGLLGIGAALLILGTGLIFMETTLPGAIALMAAAAALALLAPTLAFLGHLKWSTIFKGLGAIALALGVLAVAGTFAGPGLISLGVALLPLAGVFVLTAGAVFLFAKALQVMGGAGTKGVAVMVAAIAGFALLLPKLIISIVKGLIESVGEIASLLPKVFDSLSKILNTVIDVIIKLAPKMAVAVGVLVTALVTILGRDAPKLEAAGIKLLENLLSGLAKNIGKITDNVALVVTRFLGALADKAPEVIAAGATFLVAWITGIGNAAGRLAGAGIRAVAKFILGVAGELPKLTTLGLRVILKFLGGVAQHVGQAFIRGAHLLLSFLGGIASVIPQVIRRAVDIAGRFVRSVAHGLVRLADVGAQAIIDFLNGMARVIRHRAPEIRKAGWNLASALIEGLTGGFGDLWHKITDKVGELAHHLPHWFRKLWGIRSPSTVFREIGQFAMAGLVQGFGDSSGIEKAAENTGQGAIRAMKKSMANVPGLLDGINTSPTITPVLDLSQIKKHAGKIGELTQAPPVTIATNSMAQVAALSHEKAHADRARAESAAVAAKPSVEFKQYNTSPESLSTVEIYRRTNNQLSKIRKAVGLE
jgi:tape measure domain-containing protein